MRADFCAFIITHGRPEKVHTLQTILKAGYTGKYFLVVDDKDKKLQEYKEKFGDKVLVFSKDEIEKTTEMMDNLENRGVIIYARNACFEFAKELGFKYFIQLDDDYTDFRYRRNSDLEYINNAKIRKTIDQIWEEMISFVEKTPFQTIAMSQGGDHIGGVNSGRNKHGCNIKRKAMNSFICSTKKPFKFVGRMNEDVNCYSMTQRQGFPFGTIMSAMLNQLPTQSNSGGMTESYQANGTYIKSFYSVIACPSAVKLAAMGDPSKNAHYRIHHQVKSDACAPKILREELKKGRGHFDPYGPSRIEASDG